MVIFGHCYVIEHLYPTIIYVRCIPAISGFGLSLRQPSARAGHETLSALIKRHRALINNPRSTYLSPPQKSGRPCGTRCRPYFEYRPPWKATFYVFFEFIVK